jgi:hypothetical protein
MAELRRMVFRRPIANFLLDQTPEIDLEGALSSGKTLASDRR